MKHRLSFASISFIEEDIIEVIVDNNTNISIEMVEEYDAFLDQHFNKPFAILVNKINDYEYSYEAQLLIGTHKDIQAIAIVFYNESSLDSAKNILRRRSVDGWNIKAFNALIFQPKTSLDDAVLMAGILRHLMH